MGREFKKCPNCKREYWTELQRYDPDKSIQEEYPDEPAWKREQLISGLCSNQCFDEFIGVKPKKEFLGAD